MWLGRPVTESTWESATSLPENIVQEFEAGIQRDIQEKPFSSGGQTIHTITSTKPNSVQDCVPSSSKKTCIDPTAIESSNSG